MKAIQRRFHRIDGVNVAARRLLSLSVSRSNGEMNKILIANRGEIACRVIRTARRLGVETVAVFSDADAKAMHVSQADEAFHIGPAASTLSYLNKTKIIETAKQANCQGIHPGYGFLSENAEFAELCQDAGITFIGPPPSAIRDMGIKSTSKAIMIKAGVPVIQGYHGEDQSIHKLLTEAKSIGFPVMIKAVCGGGGKGMRIAQDENEFEAQLESAKRESLSSFGDDNVLIEKYISSPRHVEVQVFADKFGNCVYLFERDCSIQRRHQKVIEEAPAPGLSEEQRRDIGEAAVRAALAVNYVGAGTVEFILDSASGKFYFMEMNTRLQVEHPVTEMITGLDLVEWQLQVAGNKRLPLTQDEIKLNGHSFEARIYAEDTESGFLPSAGPLLHLDTPEPSADIRIETGVREGDEISVHYDPMISKLVVWAPTRVAALKRLKSSLENYHILGLDVNINFLRRLCGHPDLIAGDVHTGFIESHSDSLLSVDKPTKEDIIQAAVGKILHENSQLRENALLLNRSLSVFDLEPGFRVNQPRKRTFKIRNKHIDQTLEVTANQGANFKVKFENDLEEIEVNGAIKSSDKDKLSFELLFNGRIYRSKMVHKSMENFHIFTKNGHFTFDLDSPLHDFTEQERDQPKGAVSPMPGVVDRVFVKPGDIVKADDPVMVIIAMKMEFVIKAPASGKIKEVMFSSGDNIGKNVPVIRLEES
nr:PREDICTED: methylcrotonoyl-CoA carboxylase subunit alpha, mitochondrial [Bemisia tabaci]